MRTERAESRTPVPRAAGEAAYLPAPLPPPDRPRTAIRPLLRALVTALAQALVHALVRAVLVAARPFALAWQGTRRFGRRFRCEMEYLVLLVLLITSLSALAVGTWKDLSDEQVLIRNEPAPSSVVEEPEIVHTPELVARPDGGPAEPAESSSGPTGGDGSSSITIDGTTLWAALNAPMLYFAVRLQRRARRWYADRRQARTEDRDEEAPAVGTGTDAAEDLEDASDRVEDGGEELAEAAGEAGDPEAHPDVDPHPELDVAPDTEEHLDLVDQPDEVVPAVHDEVVPAVQDEVRTRTAEVTKPSPPGPRVSSGDGSVLIYDRRSEQRVKIDVLATLKFDGGHALVRTVDLSKSMIVCRHPVDPVAAELRNGATAEVTLRLDGAVAVLPVQVAWRRMDGDVRTLGLQFRKLDDEQTAFVRAAVVAGGEG